MSLDFSLDGTSALLKYFETGRYFDDLLPKQRALTVDIFGMSGLVMVKKKFEPRKVSIRGVLYASSASQLLTRIEDFVAFLYHGSDKQLIFSDKDDRYYSAQFLEKVELEKRGRFVPMELLFTCNDPFGYAVTPDDDTKSNITEKGYQWNITNNGQYYAFPVCTITFNQNQSHIYLSNTSIDGCRFDISKSFVEDDVLVISSKTMSIKLNDVNSPAGFGDGGDGKGEFILLRPGDYLMEDDNLMEVGTVDDDLDVDVNINFRKVYLF